MESIRDQFLLDPQIIFLNHGSFGACPRAVFETYQALQRELERQPVAFLGRQVQERMAEARQALASYVGAEPDELVYFTNPTSAMNMVARSLALSPGDEILTSDHEYGAMDRTWHFICRQTGARYIQQRISLPVESPQMLVETLWSGVTPRTRAVFISHITSPTALIFPVQEICRRARQAGILSIVDGAHAPGQIPLNLSELGADLYAGACHKWLMAPKGAAFLYARREVQGWLDPLVVSWGYESEQPSGSQFIDYHEWQGTRDLAAFLSVPAAIHFQSRPEWESIRQGCRQLARQARQAINRLTGLKPICPDPLQEGDYTWYAQMFSVRLPQEVDLESLKTCLYDQHHIEVPTILWNGEKFLRVSVQGYNQPNDLQALLAALREMLPVGQHN